MRALMTVLAIGLVAAMATHAGAQADEASQCPVKLRDTQYQLSITDNQRAVAVKDLGVANRMIEEYRNQLRAAQAELAKLKKPEDAKPAK